MRYILITFITITLLSSCSYIVPRKTIDTNNKSLYNNKEETTINIYDNNNRYKGYLIKGNNITTYYIFKNGIHYYNGYSK